MQWKTDACGVDLNSLVRVRNLFCSFGKADVEDT